jgi:heat shock protein HslJ
MSSRRIAALAALVTLLAGCTPGAGAGGTLEATHWILDSYLEGDSLRIAPDGFYADAEFDVARVSGFSGCNSYDALYRANGRLLLVSMPATTLMACDQATMDLEQTYLGLLEGSRSYSVRRDTLTVFDADRRPALIFDAAPRNPLLGRWWVDSYSTSPGTVVAVAEGTTLDATFALATVGGSAGCNTYSGTYGTNGEVVRIGPLATTRLACDTDVMDQETAFLAALEDARRIESHGSSLTLTDRTGHTLVNLVRPAQTESPSPGGEPAPSATPTATPAATKTAKPTATATSSPAPTASPTPAPTASPTPAPTANPSPSPTPGPSVPLLPTGSCPLLADGVTVATITYPGSWFTLEEPPTAACRYFDPEPITVPADPSTLRTAVMTGTIATPYQDAVAAATDPDTWTVAAKSETAVGGVPVTCILATAVSDATGLPTGTARFSCLADVGSAGTVQLWTVGEPADPTFMANSGVVGLMTAASSFTASQ